MGHFIGLDIVKKLMFQIVFKFGMHNLHLTLKPRLFAITKIDQVILENDFKNKHS